MLGIGFTQGKANPCTFYHTEKKVRIVIHGDDFTILGMEDSLDWFRRHVQATYSAKLRGRIGPAKSDLKSIIILNRVLEWREDGIYYESDQRHAELIA